jgi:hypothetical protein
VVAFSHRTPQSPPAFRHRACLTFSGDLRATRFSRDSAWGKVEEFRLEHNECCLSGKVVAPLMPLMIDNRNTLPHDDIMSSMRILGALSNRLCTGVLCPRPS